MLIPEATLDAPPAMNPHLAPYDLLDQFLAEHAVALYVAFAGLCLVAIGLLRAYCHQRELDRRRPVVIWFPPPPSQPPVLPAPPVLGLPDGRGTGRSGRAKDF